jgi:hypothetical protein
MVGINGLVVPLRAVGLILRPFYPVRIVLGLAGVIRVLCREHLLKQVQFGWGQRRKKRLDYHCVQARPIDMETRGCPMARRERGAGIALLGLIGHPHLVSTTAADH